MGGSIAYVGLGANLGAARATLEQAVDEIGRLPGVQVLRCSPFYRTAPVDAAGPDFVNAVVEIRTERTARELLDDLQAIERRHGRLRPFRNAPRTLDLDLLLHGRDHIDEPGLQVPHPRMHLRAFVLRPLHDLRPDLEIPGRGRVDAWLDAAASQPIERLPD